MKNRIAKRFGCTFVAMLLLASTAQASYVSGISPGSNFGPMGNGNFIGPAPGTPPLPIGGVQTIDLSIDVLKIKQPFTLNFTRTGTGTHQLDFRITLRNSTTTPPEPIYQLEITRSGAAGLSFLDVPAPKPWSDFNNTFDTLFVGGSGGHSFELLPLATTSTNFITFSMSSVLTSSFALTFTANPEPRTVVLSMLACVVFGWMIYRRRRESESEHLAISTAV
ncbi:MAG: PEP-CTERM sorting domain-containing protein [Planctomycetaceae bacterium]